jgi:TRAP-type transport system periplasmic protein
MKRRYFATLFIAAALALAVPGSMPQTADAQGVTTLRIATLAPQGSSWMKIFNAWNASVKKETDGKVQLRFYAGGVAGDERDFVRKMRAGQMDGAAVTSTGLGLVVRPVLVLAVPGVFDNYQQLDRARTMLEGEFDKQFLDNGYKLLGWGDVGEARLFSNAKRIQRPSDLKEVRPWAWRDDVIFTEVLKVVGANPVRLGVPEVYPALQTGMVDTVPASAVAAVSLQWYTRLKYVSKESTSTIVGATILKKDKYEALTPDQRKALDETSEKAHKALRAVIRKDDKRAYRTVLQRGLEEVPARQYEKEWTAVGDKVRQNLSGRLYPASLLKRVQQAAGGS